MNRSEYIGRPPGSFKRAIPEDQTSLCASASILIKLLSATKLPDKLEACRFAVYEMSPPFVEQPGHRHLQTAGNRFDFVVHQVTFLPLNARDPGLVNADPLGSQPPGKVLLRNRRPGLEAGVANAFAYQVAFRWLVRLFHSCPHAGNRNRFRKCPNDYADLAYIFREFSLPNLPGLSRSRRPSKRYNPKAGRLRVTMDEGHRRVGNLEQAQRNI